MYFENLYLIIIIFFSVFLILKKFRFLTDNISYSNHKKIGAKNKSPIMLGGLFVLIIMLVFMPNNMIEIKIIFTLITFLGVLSDKNILPSPKVRFIFQITIILSLIHFNDLYINDLRADFFNDFLLNKYFNVFFTAFCLAVLINGSNFIDGLNGLLSGYFILVLYSVFYVSNSNYEINLVDAEFLETIFFSLLLFFIYNISGKVYLGDSGSYLISIFLGSMLIKFYLYNPIVSPFYIALILWYPVFENLFSLIRRFFNNKKISNPDNRHLHQLVFLYFNQKNYINKNMTNPISSLTILLLNLPTFYFASTIPSKSSSLIIILILNIVIYLIFYNFFIKQLKVKK